MSREYSACLVRGIPLKMYRLVGVLWCGGRGVPMAGLSIKLMQEISAEPSL